jgi:hypothetical protein
MARTARDHTRNGPAIAPDDPDATDNGAAAHQRVVRTPAGAPIKAPPGAASSVFALAAVAKKAEGTQRGGKRNTLPPLDLSKLVIKTGVPKPPRRIGSPGNSKYDDMLALIPVGSSTELPAQYFMAVQAYVKKRHKVGKPGTYSVRRINPQVCGVWRDA